jgi:small subunit ribosomal protein S2
MKKSDANILEDLFTAQAHLGHKTNRIHPKAEKYIYKIDNGVSIIDLTQTATLLQKAEEFASSLGKDGKTLLVVGTKKVAAAALLELCTKYGVPYITSKWPPGLITNFDSIMKNIKKIQDLRSQRDAGEWEQLVKHEQSQLKRELSRAERVYGGISGFKKIPDALFVIDLKKEKNALIEGKKSNTPVIAITDTNVNPDVEFPIPANDDAETSIRFIAEKVLSAYSSAKEQSK